MLFRSLEPLIQRLAEKPELEECECDEGDGGDESGRGRGRGRGRGSITTYTVMSSTARETMAQKPKAGRTTKIRVYPTICQRRILDEWFRGSRFIYNHALASIKRRRKRSGQNRMRWRKCKDYEALCKYWTTEAALKERGYDWVIRTPAGIRQSAVRELKTAYQTNHSKRMKTSKQHHYAIRARRTAEYQSRLRNHREQLRVKKENLKQNEEKKAADEEEYKGEKWRDPTKAETEEEEELPEEPRSKKVHSRRARQQTMTFRAQDWNHNNAKHQRREYNRIRCRFLDDEGGNSKGGEKRKAKGKRLRNVEIIQMEESARKRQRKAAKAMNRITIRDERKKKRNRKRKVKSGRGSRKKVKHEVEQGIRRRTIHVQLTKAEIKAKTAMRRKKRILQSLPWRKFFLIFPTLFMEQGVDPRLRTRQNVPIQLQYDCKFLKDSLGRYFLCIPGPLRVHHDSNMKADDGIIAVDPGVRTFQTGYSPTGHVTEYCPHPDGRTILQDLHHKASRLQSQIDTLEKDHPYEQATLQFPMITDKRHYRSYISRIRYRLRQSRKRILQTIRNKVDDMQNKCVHDLVTDYHTVLLPHFQTKELARKQRRQVRTLPADELMAQGVLEPQAYHDAMQAIEAQTRRNEQQERELPEATREEIQQQRYFRLLSKATTRDLYTWSHYRFRMRLIQKTREYPRCRVVICDEHFTSKTCSACGRTHKRLGAHKDFECPHDGCGAKADRDFNAALNILLLFLTIPRRAQSLTMT